MIEPRLTAQSLSRLASQYHADWLADVSIDWEQAEHLVEACSLLTPETLEHCEHIKGIVDYAAQNDEWDSGDVKEWPTLIISDLNSDAVSLGTKLTINHS